MIQVGALASPFKGRLSPLLFHDTDGAVAPLNYASNFVVQASTNLLDWQALVGSFSLTNGWLFFDEDDAVYWSRRFYRVMEP